MTELPKDSKNYTYDDWLDYFRKRSASENEQDAETLKTILPSDGYAALKRWFEIYQNPSKMDKLYQGRLKAEKDADIMEIAVGDDDEAFYVALIRENVAQLNSSNISQQEVARLTQNINIFRKELREIRSRKPKKNSTLAKVLEKANLPSTKSEKSPKNTQKRADKKRKKE